MAHVSAGQDGIQKLLAAEKEAQEIVAKARKGTPSCTVRSGLSHDIHWHWCHQCNDSEVLASWDTD